MCSTVGNIPNLTISTVPTPAKSQVMLEYPPQLWGYPGVILDTPGTSIISHTRPYSGSDFQSLYGIPGVVCKLPRFL